MRFVTAAKGDTDQELYYVLDMGAVGGLFKYDMELDEETRLMHSQGFHAEDISRHPQDGSLIVSVLRDDGTRGLSLTRHDGLFGRSLTSSDSMDQAPSWLLDGTRCVLFQSAAIGRNEHGAAVGHSPYRIERQNQLLGVKARMTKNAGKPSRMALNFDPMARPDEIAAKVKALGNG